MIFRKNIFGQHSDLPGGHPPEYGPSIKLLNFIQWIQCVTVSVIQSIIIRMTFTELSQNRLKSLYTTNIVPEKKKGD